MAPILLVIDSRISSTTEYIKSEHHYRVSYEFPEQYAFDEPAYARLVFAGGLGNGPVCVFTDFTRAQPFCSGHLLPYLGRSDSKTCSWLPLASNFIPNTGFIVVGRADRTIPGNHRAETIQVVIEVATESWIFRMPCQKV